MKVNPKLLPCPRCPSMFKTNQTLQSHINDGLCISVNEQSTSLICDENFDCVPTPTRGLSLETLSDLNADKLPPNPFDAAFRRATTVSPVESQTSNPFDAAFRKASFSMSRSPTPPLYSSCDQKQYSIGSLRKSSSSSQSFDNNQAPTNCKIPKLGLSRADTIPLSQENDPFIGAVSHQSSNSNATNILSPLCSFSLTRDISDVSRLLKSDSLFNSSMTDALNDIDFNDVLNSPLSPLALNRMGVRSPIKSVISPPVAHIQQPELERSHETGTIQIVNLDVSPYNNNNNKTFVSPHIDQSTVTSDSFTSGINSSSHLVQSGNMLMPGANRFVIIPISAPLQFVSSVQQELPQVSEDVLDMSGNNNKSVTDNNDNSEQSNIQRQLVRDALRRKFGCPSQAPPSSTSGATGVSSSHTGEMATDSVSDSVSSESKRSRKRSVNGNIKQNINTNFVDAVSKESPGRPSSSNDGEFSEMEDMEIKKQLIIQERNRVAAQKCREKKKCYINQLEKKVKSLSEKSKTWERRYKIVYAENQAMKKFIAERFNSNTVFTISPTENSSFQHSFS